MSAAISALRHRARTGIASAVFTPGWNREAHHQFWQGYAKALRDLTRGAGEQLAAKDAALGEYQPPAVFARALALLADNIETLTRAEILQRIADAGIERPFQSVPDLDVGPADQFEDSIVCAVDADDEHAVTGVVVGDGATCHPRSVGGAQ